jgi:excinuclease ABC subunit C
VSRESQTEREERHARLAARVKDLPKGPACYLMKDRRGAIFYVGKAGNLRARVRSYFSGSDTRQFVAWLDELLYDLDFILVRNEKEALLLERTLVRQHKPRFNVLLQDDKNFIHLRLDTQRPPESAPARVRYPRLTVVRNPKDDGARYFGPYHSATSVRQTLRLVNRYFLLRTCSDSVLENRTRPCLQHQIGRCPAPCVFDVPDYGEGVSEAALFLAGRSEELVDRIESRMWEASQREDYEVAARLRDQREAVKTSLDRQVVTEVSRRRDQDVVAVARSGPLLEIVRVVVRGGGMRGTDHFSFDHQEFPTEELLSSFLAQLYGDLDPALLPDELLTSLELGEDAAALAAALADRRGRRVEVRKPARGSLRALVEIAQKNADVALAERLRRSEVRQQGMERLQERMKMNRLPRVIECFDISLFQGTDAVASQVCFVDGAPEKARYRRYNIKTVEGTDDFLMLYEALCRRLKRGKEEGDLPDLLVVDGGKGQLNVALAAFKDLEVPVGSTGPYVAGIAKARTLDTAKAARFAREGGFEGSLVEGEEIQRSPERLFVPGVKDPIALRPHTAERFLMEQVRDEAHRFAITAHRKRRKKRTLTSRLDEIPGVGPSKRRALLKTIGSLKAVRAASLEELAAVPGIGLPLAQRILAALHVPVDEPSPLDEHEGETLSGVVAGSISRHDAKGTDKDA